MSINEVLKKLEVDSGYIYKRMRKLNLTSIMYVIGDIIANYFYYLILEDYEEGMKELCRFVINSKDMSFKEIIEKYIRKIQITRYNINEFMDKRNKILTMIKE